VTEVIVQLRDAQPANPVPPEVRFRKALKCLLRDFGLRAEWAPCDRIDPVAKKHGAEGTSDE
jgi:hypothetical protein